MNSNLKRRVLGECVVEVRGLEERDELGQVVEEGADLTGVPRRRLLAPDAYTTEGLLAKDSRDASCERKRHCWVPLVLNSLVSVL